MNGDGSLVGVLLALKAVGHRPPRQARREWVLDAILADQRNRLWYQEELLGTVRVLDGGAREMLQQVRGEIEFQSRMRGKDAAPSVDEALRRFAAKFGDVGFTARRLAKDAAEKNAKSVDERLGKEIHRAMGIDLGPVFRNGDRIAATMEAQAAENARLITEISADAAAAIKNVISQGWASGARWEALVDDVGQVIDDTETRARLIARDQTGKMNAAFNEARQVEAGISMYDWSGIGDERERPSHRAMEGVRCRWDSPPLVDGEHVHPGEAILCRCGARPVFVVLEQEEAA